MKTKTIKMLTVGSVVALISMGGIGEIKAEREGHGGDVFEMESKHAEMFDKIEHEVPFTPDTHPETMESFERFIVPQINVLKSKLPLTGTYLESLFRSEGLYWFFVTATLKEREDEGETNIILQWNKKQIAINQDNIIQINYDLFKNLPAPQDVNEISSIAYLVSHEVFWSAVGARSAKRLGGEVIRRLSALFLNPNLSRQSGEVIAKTFLQLIETSYGTYNLSAVLKADLARFNEDFIFDTISDTSRSDIPGKELNAIMTMNSKNGYIPPSLRFHGIGKTLEEARFDTITACKSFMNRIPDERNVVQVRTQKIVREVIVKRNKRQWISGADAPSPGSSKIYDVANVSYAVVNARYACDNEKNSFSFHSVLEPTGLRFFNLILLPTIINDSPVDTVDVLEQRNIRHESHDGGF